MRKIYSHTKRSALAKCPRQYFYEYYAPQVEYIPAERQSLLFDFPESEHKVISSVDVGQVVELKTLSSAYQVAGIILHQLIAQHWQHLDWSSEWFEQQAGKRLPEKVLSMNCWLARND